MAVLGVIISASDKNLILSGSKIWESKNLCFTSMDALPALYWLKLKRWRMEWKKGAQTLV
jgi:hypothetical protein